MLGKLGMKQLLAFVVLVNDENIDKLIERHHRFFDRTELWVVDIFDDLLDEKPRPPQIGSETDSLRLRRSQNLLDRRADLSDWLTVPLEKCEVSVIQ